METTREPHNDKASSDKKSELFIKTRTMLLQKLKEANWKAITLPIEECQCALHITVRQTTTIGTNGKRLDDIDYYLITVPGLHMKGSSLDQLAYDFIEYSEIIKLELRLQSARRALACAEEFKKTLK